MIQTRSDAVRELVKLICEDAQQHGLYEPYKACRTRRSAGRLLLYRAMDELWQAIESLDEGGSNEEISAHTAQQMADTIIMLLSASGYLDVPIWDAIESKRLRNMLRPYQHLNEKGESDHDPV